jgi:hypothetical protein
MVLLKILFWLSAIPFGLWLKAIVAVDLWSWFLVPLGAPVVGVAHALGLTLLGWFFGSGLDSVKVVKKTDASWERWVTIQLVVLATWGYGAVFNWLT